MMPMRWIRLSLLVGFVGAAGLVGRLSAGEAKAKAEIGQPAPGFKLPDLDGKTVSLPDFRGKLVVLEWMSQKCPVSNSKAAGMAELSKKYAEKDVVWLGIDSSATGHPYHTTAEQKKAYAKQKSLTYPVLSDPEGTVGRSYGARTTPHMFIVDKEGLLVYDGAIDDKKPGGTNYVSQALDALLAGSAVPTPKTTPYGCTVKYAGGR